MAGTATATQATQSIPREEDVHEKEDEKARMQIHDEEANVLFFDYVLNNKDYYKLTN